MNTIHPPTDRTCERCEREEVWDEDRETWVSPPDGDEGIPHCLHEWDINGTYSPVRGD
jgi:hypothetical protein